MEALIFNPQKPSPKRALILFVLPAVIAIVFLIVFLKSWTAVAFFITVWLSIIILLWGTYSKKVSVKLSEEGVYVRVNATGLVPWEYISGFGITEAVNTKAIAVKMHDPESFIETRGRLSRAIMRSNLAYGSPVLIAESEFTMPLEEALEGMVAYKEALGY
jgi:uncharacterized protein (DUF58 family)